MKPRRLLRASALALALPATVAFAQAGNLPDWPARSISVIVPFPAGGGTDLVVRSLQSYLQQALGQPVVIENRGGAGGTIGSAAVAKAAPDGYTLGAITTSTHAASVGVYAALPYDPLNDFAPIGLIGTSPYVLAAGQSFPARNLRELLAELRKQPGRHSYASVGAGTLSHLIAEQFRKSTGTDILHVPYKGAAPAYTDLLGNQVQLMFDNPAGLAPFIRSGKLRALAQTEPSALFPDLPTFEKQGLPGLDQTLWYGLAAPKGTPRRIVERVNQALNAALVNRALNAELASKGVAARPVRSDELQRMIEKDTRYWGTVARSVGARAD